MIPGGRHTVIFCVMRLEHYVFISEILAEDSIQFLNQIMNIVHTCADRWDGSANKSEGERYVITTRGERRLCLIFVATESIKAILL